MHSRVLMRRYFVPAILFPLAWSLLSGFSDSAEAPDLTETPAGTPASPKSSLFMPLGDYAFPPEAVLAAESALVRHPAFPSARGQLEGVLEGRLSASEREALQQRCGSVSSLALGAQTPETLACLPLVLEARLAARASSPARPRKVKAEVPSTVARWQALAPVSFSEALARIRIASLEELDLAMRAYQEAAKDCTLAQAGVALLTQAESLLPDTAARAHMETLYPKLAACLSPTSENFERIHLRMGLLYVLEGKLERAQASLRQASAAAAPREPYRTLFWLGTVQSELAAQNGDDASSAPDPWQELQNRFPLEIHSVTAAQYLGQNPWERAAAQADPWLVRRSEGGEADTVSFVCELLQARQRSAALKRWMSLAHSTVEETNPARLLHFGVCANAAGAYLESFSFLYRSLRRSPQPQVSKRFLELYFPKPYSREIAAAAKEGLDPAFLFGLVRQESAFEPMARSAANARGLMQLLPQTARRFVKGATPPSLHEPTTNLMAGTRFLAELFSKYQGREELVLAAYNAGPTPVERWRARVPGAWGLLFADLIPYQETRFYVSNILRNAYWYRQVHGMSATAPTQAEEGKNEGSEFVETLVPANPPQGYAAPKGRTKGATIFSKERSSGRQ